MSKITIEGLAAMIKRGFDEVHKSMATQDDVSEIRAQLDRIEMHAGGLDNRVSALEDQMRVIRTKLGVK
jgi:hypothetical protein